ncbi:MAG: ABC transporter ATP-binding protein [Coriobacteriaceae bacterium]|nr:ABC transporter ATP-binding protein [Coriobacteriaceae bacterium]
MGALATGQLARGEFAIELENVSFAYGPAGALGSTVLNDVTLKVPYGQCLCITGPSGCGKTTLTQLVNGLIPSFYEGETKGTVRVGGIDVNQWEMDDLCRFVGSVFQNPRSQFFNLDTTSELAYGCENLGIERREILRAIAQSAEALELDGLLERDIHDLSGGQRQLLALGATCAMGAELLVLDEPTANLDAAATHLVKRALQRLRAQGKTIVIVEHRLHWLDGLVDRVVRIGNGCVAGDWPAREFASLSTSELAAMGLRAWSLKGLPKCFPPAAENAAATPAAARQSVQANGLRAGYRKHRDILRGLSLSAEGGHAIAVIGRNGQGKSTFASVMSGLMRESYGGISIDDRPLAPRDRVGSVYLVLQESGYQLFGSSVLEEFAIGLSRKNECDQGRVENLLGRFGLLEKKDRHPASISGGEKQRLAMAVGIHSGARILVLDEPTSGLDLTNMARCASEIRRLTEAGCCVLVITHDAEFALAACDQVIEIDGGRVRASYDLDEHTAERALRVLAPSALAP